MTTFTQQEIEFLQKHSNEVFCILHNTRLHIVKHYFLESWLSVFDSLLGSWHFPHIAQSTLLAFSSPYFFSPVSGSTPPPVPFTFSHLCPGFATTPTPILCIPPTLLIPMPPSHRYVNTSGWASMTTGHQLFQISGNHRK